MKYRIHPKFKDPEYYMFRAEEVNAIADCMKDPFARDALRKVAMDYQQMAMSIKNLRGADNNVRDFPKEEVTFDNVDKRKWS